MYKTADITTNVTQVKLLDINVDSLLHSLIVRVTHVQQLKILIVAMEEQSVVVSLVGFLTCLKRILV